MSRYLLVFHNDLGDSSQLIEGRLLLIDSKSDKIVNVYLATSGAPGAQSFGEQSRRGAGAIPRQDLVGIDHYTVDTKPIPMPGVKGVEGNFYKINPHFVNIDGIQRGDFGVHRDANAPGSAGCVVLRSANGWSAYQEDMKRLNSEGVSSIPLFVSYSR